MNPLLSLIEARSAKGGWFMAALLTASLIAAVASLGRLAWLVVSA